MRRSVRPTLHCLKKNHSPTAGRTTQGAQPPEYTHRPTKDATNRAAPTKEVQWTDRRKRCTRSPNGSWRPDGAEPRLFVAERSSQTKNTNAIAVRTPQAMSADW